MELSPGCVAAFCAMLHGEGHIRTYTLSSSLMSHCCLLTETCTIHWLAIVSLRISWYTRLLTLLTSVFEVAFRTRSIDLIPELEYECSLLKITPTRILLLSEYKEDFQHMLTRSLPKLTSRSKEKSGGYSVYCYSRISSIERALRV